MNAPVLQLLTCKKMKEPPNGKGQKAVDRYRMQLSDGVHSCTAVLADCLNYLVVTGELDVKAVMRLKKYHCNIIANGKSFIVITELEIVKQGRDYSHGKKN